MRFYLFFLVLFCEALSFSNAASITGLEDDDEPISVFTTPGQTEDYCPAGKVCKPAVGSLDRASKIELLGKSETHSTLARDRASLIQEEYTRIQFSYDRMTRSEMVHQEGEGYIPSDHISVKKTTPLYSMNTYKKTKSNCSLNKNNLADQINDTVTPLAKSIENLSITEKADLLSQTVGFCPLKPATRAPSAFPDKNSNLYDYFIKSKIDQKLTSTNIPPILNEKNQPMTKANLIEIDALARTMYGEMAICYKSGLQYPMAVAKIILNRAENKSRQIEFIKKPHDFDTPDTVKVCTTPSQFNCWMKKTNGIKNNTLHQALCPPQNQNAPYWNGKQASKFETDLWKNSVRIATEAILHPEQFKKRTAKIDGYFYTSGRGKFYNMKQQHDVLLDGNPLDKNKCLEIWKE